MKMQRTLVLIKPDGVKKGLTEADVVAGSNLKVIKSHRLTPSWDLACKHYVEHEEKAYFHRITLGLSSGDVIAVIVEGEDAVTTMRAIVGNRSDSTTLRGKYSNPDVMHENAVHASDSIESAEREIPLWFTDVSGIDM